MKIKISPKWDINYPNSPRYGVPTKGPYHIYILIDTRTNRVKYVGVAKNPELRFKQHLDKKSGNKLLVNWKKKLNKSNNYIKMILVDSATKSTWQEAEQAWIAYYKSLGKTLNRHKGGILELFTVEVKPSKKKKTTKSKYIKKYIPKEKLQEIEEARKKALLTLQNNPKLAAQIANSTKPKPQVIL